MSFEQCNFGTIFADNPLDKHNDELSLVPWRFIRFQGVPMHPDNPPFKYILLINADYPSQIRAAVEYLIGRIEINGRIRLLILNYEIHPLLNTEDTFDLMKEGY